MRSNMGLPTRIGYVIVRPGASLPLPRGRLYRGIDRPLSVPDPTLPQTASAGRVWARYLNADEGGLVAADLDLARSLATQLAQVGEPTEVIYAEVTVPPPSTLGESKADRQRADSLAWLASRCAKVPAPSEEFEPIGFDVATPLPTFHSALYQPGLVRKDARFVANLNQSGLVDDIGYAAELMHVANATGYLLSLFGVVEVRALRRGSL